MKYAAVAVTLVGAVVADAQWETWSTTATVEDPKTWSTWDPKDPKTWSTWEPKDPKTWSTWDPKDPEDPKTWSSWDPNGPWKHTTTTASWETWADKTTTAECSYVTEIATSKCIPGHPDQCWPYKKTSTVYPTDCATWGVWETTVTIPGELTITKTWNKWEEATNTPVVVTSIVKPGWEKDSWFGPEWPEAKDGQCAVNVVTSYGYPIWIPAPEPTTVVKAIESTWDAWSSVTPVAKVDPTTWADWSSVVTPVVKVDPTTWADWSSVVTPVVKVDPTTWAAWSSVVTPVVEADPTTWATWAPAPTPGKPGKAEHAPNGNKWAITYGPYDEAGKCKTVEVIKADIKNIKDIGFTTVRVYSTDCKTLDYVGDACRENGLKIIIGVFIAKSGIEGAKPQVKDIVAWAQWDIVELVVIGNEAVFQGFCQPDELVAFIKSCKEQFVAVGYTGPCTTTEPLGEWQKSSDKYCDVVDVVSANLYAYFNADCTADKAGEFIQSQITILTGLCKDKKDTFVMECGWPTEGSCNGKACPGKKEQAVAIKGIQDTCGAKIVFFNYEDEHWKQPGQYGVEQHWGVYDVFSGKGDSWSSWGKW